MQRAAAFVDIQPAAVGVRGDDFRPQPFKDGGRDAARGAVGAVDDELFSLEGAGGAAGKPFDVRLLPGERIISAHGKGAGKGIFPHIVFGALFLLFGELSAVLAEHFQTVIGRRIVRRADDDAEISAAHTHKVRHRRRRQDAPAEHPASARSDARRQCEREHIRRHARILPQYDRRFRFKAGKRIAEREGGTGSQLLPRDAADAVRSEQITHFFPPLSFCG